MELKIRGLSTAAVYKFDREAKKNGLSRNAYLVNLLEQTAALGLYQNQEERHHEIEEKMLAVIGRNTAMLAGIVKILNGGEE